MAVHQGAGSLSYRKAWADLNSVLQVACDPETRCMHGLTLEASCSLAANSRSHKVLWEFVGELKYGSPVKVERWRVNCNGVSAEVVLKYAARPTPRSVREVRAVRALRGAGVAHFKGLLVPDVYYVSSNQVSHQTLSAVLVAPYFEYPTLWQLLSRSSDWDLARLQNVLFHIGSVLRDLHGSDRMRGGVLPRETAQRMSEELIACKGLEGTAIERLRLCSCLAAVRRERLAELVKEIRELGTGFIHGDCFAYQILVADDHTILLTDWEQVGHGLGLGDVAQLLASISLAFLANGGTPKALIPLVRALECGYGARLSTSLAYQILELRALVRFSLLTTKYFNVVPLVWGPHGRRRFFRQPFLRMRHYGGLRAYYRFLLAKIRAVEAGNFT